MGRRPRVHFPGAIYHVYNRGNGGKDIFLDEIDFQRFLDELSRLKPLGLTFFAWCLMPNHFHLLVMVDKVPLSNLMQRVLSRYSQYFNFRRGTFGSVFQPRYKADPIDSNEYLLAALRYIHLNPVSAHLAADPAQWRWSGHRGLLGASDQLLDSKRALGFFAASPDAARAAYAEFMSLRRERPRVKAAHTPTGSQNLGLIAEDCARAFLVPVNELKNLGKRRAATRSRRLFVKRALDCGFPRPDIASFLGCNLSAISRMLSDGDLSHGMTQ